MIRVCEPLIGQRELELVTECLKSGWVGSQGEFIPRFEQAFARYCGCAYGIATTSGTTGLHLAFRALGIGPGDEVIIPAFTMAATALAVVYTGARPVLVDAEPQTWNMDPAQIEARITGRTKAIVPVHLYGHPCDMAPILGLAEKYELYVVEDAAEAHGALYRGQRVGGLGDMGCFSFYANKIITTGEGGMVVTGNPALAEKMRSLKNLAMSPEKHFVHIEVGYNYRMTNVAAAIGLAQFERIDELVERRRRNARLYNERLQNTARLRLPLEQPWARSVYWMYSILLEDGSALSRDGLMATLAQKGIETRSLFVPMHQQPVFLNMGLFKGEHYPVAEDLARRGLYLPSGPGLTETDIDYICHQLKSIPERHH